MRTRFENLDPERQERLIESAIAEFCDQGFEAGSLNRILKNASMSKSSFYYYFEDKIDIFNEVGRRALVELARQIGYLSIQDLTAETFWPSLEEHLSRTLQALEKEAWSNRIVRLYFHYRDNSAADGGRSPLFRDIQSWVLKVLEKGCEIGAVRTDLPKSLLCRISMGLADAIDHWMTEDDAAEPGANKAALLQGEAAIFRRLLKS